MIGYRPPRPGGSSPEALFMQAVWDYIWGQGSRQNDVSGARTSRTTRGVQVITKPVKGGGSKGTVDCPYG